MSDLDRDRFTFRQAAQARDYFAQIMGELEFVKTQLAALPTRRDQAFVPLRTMFGSAVIGTAIFMLWLEMFLASLSLNESPSRRSCTHRS